MSQFRDRFDVIGGLIWPDLGIILNLTLNTSLWTLAFGLLPLDLKNMPDNEKLSKASRRIFTLAAVVLVLDQVTKWLVLKRIFPGDEITVIPGFFNLTHRANTGAAWSMFTGSNRLLAIVAVIALVVLFMSKHHFEAHTLMGQVSLGLIFGGIVGNLEWPMSGLRPT